MQESAALGESRGMGTYRPMSTTSLEMERAILAEVNAQIYRDRDRLQAHQEMTEREETWMGQFRAEFERAGKGDTGLEKDLADEDEYFRPWSSRIGKKDVPQSIKDKQWSRERNREQGAEFDVYEQMEQKIDELQRSYEQLMAAKRAEGTPAIRKDVRRTKEAADSEEGAGEGGSEVKGSVVDELSRLQMGRKKGGAFGEQRNAFGVRSEGRAAEPDLRGMDLPARAKAILGAHKTFASFSNDKFNQQLVVGEKHFKEGKYYRSAGAYTLASIYRPGEPLAYAGKSHALFAAGEYVSSALFISRAIIMESERGKTRDCEIPQFLALIAEQLAFIDRDKLEDRVADLEGWRQNSNSAELQFLLGYIYYQMGDLNAAWGAIDGAYKKTPEEPAVVALREVIYNKKQSDRDKKP
jgi:tetratricopeptide (TPR) repeat protein